jgi:hypothetical protein
MMKVHGIARRFSRRNSIHRPTTFIPTAVSRSTASSHPTPLPTPLSIFVRAYTSIPIATAVPDPVPLSISTLTVTSPLPSPSHQPPPPILPCTRQSICRRKPTTTHPPTSSLSSTSSRDVLIVTTLYYHRSSFPGPWMSWRTNRSTGGGRLVARWIRRRRYLFVGGRIGVGGRGGDSFEGFSG